MKISWQKILPHTIIVALFMGIALAFFSPVLQGKKILQSDIVQYTGMAKERNDFRETRESYWTNSAFGGMPTYQLGAEYPHNYIKSLDKVIRFLPRPADYLFLYFTGFYVLLLVLKINYRYAFLGALAFGFSTYLIIILGVGHNAKAHAVGYFSFVLAGILLAFQRKYWLGFLLTTIALALEINANHFQMTYYLLLLCLVFGLVELFKAIREKQLKIFIKTISILVGAAVFSLLLNVTSLLATQEYAEFSTRGKSELTILPDGTPKTNQNGLSKEYITEYSYGISESFNLIVPRLFGGANNENVGKDSETYKFLISNGVPQNSAFEFSKNLPTYWGEQPIVSAPAYIGIVVFFLFILGIFSVKNRSKWWLLGGSILSLVLSWGKNFEILTDFMIDYFPLYNKFRAVTSIQVILELCVPVLAVLGLFYFVKAYKSAENQEHKKLQQQLYYAFGITAGILILLYLFKGAFSFVGINDEYYAQLYGSELIQIIQQDRKAMYSADIFRNLLLVSVAFVILWIFLRKKLAEKWLLVGLAILISVDMISVAKRYVNDENFVSQREFEQPFTLSPNEQKILADDSNFRVFSVREGLNGARTSYFFHSVGGYHAAKPRRLQELFDYQVYKNNIEVLNMLNVKYFIQLDENNQPQVNRNPEALGNAWFVKQVRPIASADLAMKILDTLKSSKSAILHEKILDKKVALATEKHYSLDSLATIKLQHYSPDKLVYISDNQNDGFAVFSEIYYPKGWVATIDEKPATIHRVNYTLRGLQIPAGKHTIEFRFEPQVVKTGSFITLISNILLGILLVFWGISSVVKNKKK